MPQSEHDNRTISSVKSGHLRSVICGQPTSVLTLVCCLDAKNASIGVNVVSIGSLTLSIVHPREVFKPAILLNACAIIAVHNHPSGDPMPSPEDRTLTTRLREAGDLLGIRLLDHLILGEDRLYSFADHGWAL